MDFLTPGAAPPILDTARAERRLLETSVTDDDRRTLNAKLIFVQEGRAADSIAEYAKQRHIDLVVVAKRNST